MPRAQSATRKRTAPATRHTEQLRSKVAALRDEYEAVILEGQIKAHRLVSSAVVREGEWGDRVSPREYLDDTPGWYGTDGEAGRISRPTDHKNGDNFPFWMTEPEHQMQRGISRHIVATDEVATGIIENHCNYVLGKRGFQFKVIPRSESDAGLAAKAQRLVDQFLEFNKWTGVLEREAVGKTPRDGELLIGLEDRGGSLVEAVHLDPSFITEPDSPRDLESHYRLGQLEWKYGVASEPNRPAKTYGVFCSWYGSDTDWEFYPSNRLIHGKLNVDSDVKRGMSDFFSVYTNLCRASKLFGNTMEGAAVQAAIAYIREHAPGVSTSAVRDFVDGLSTDTVNTPVPKGGTQRRTGRKVRPGTVVDTPAGMKHLAGPMGDSRRASGYIEVMAAALRRIGIRWTMPEYMISGDASNANFSSTLVSESPFVKAIEAKQGWYAVHFADMVMKVLMIKANVLGLLPRQVAERLTINVELPEVAVRDREKETRVRQAESDAGILSDDTWASEVNRNLAEERKKGARRKETSTAPAGPGGAADFGGSGSKPAPAPDAAGAAGLATAQTSQLNGAQMQAAISIVTAVAAGTMPRDAGIAQLVQFFNLSKDQADAMMGSAGTGQPTKPNPIPSPAGGTGGAGQQPPDLQTTVAKAVSEAIQRHAWHNYP